jgi:multidrug efflux pump subunit AcrA (membrane-fusion protein)
MGNLDLEEQIAQVQTELARVNADADRLSGELRVQQEAAAGSEWHLAQRRREFDDLDTEEQQIQRGQGNSSGNFVLASTRPLAAQELPAALAALEAEADQLQAKLTEANQELGRTRKLYDERLLARNQMEAAEAKSAALASELSAARERLKAALIEHHRTHASTENAVNIAKSNLSAGRAQVWNLTQQLEAARRLRGSLEERLVVLEKKHAQFALIAPMTGILFGEELPRMAGQYFTKGTEICHLADTHELMVRVLVAEQALGDVATGQHVRLKTRAFPDRIFQGVVSKISGEAELDPNGQRSFRVELTIQNPDLSLRPGMTVFARIDFGRHSIAWLAIHKLKQALRPELWML